MAEMICKCGHSDAHHLNFTKTCGNWGCECRQFEAPTPAVTEGMPSRPPHEHVGQFTKMLTSMSFVQYAEFKRWADAMEALVRDERAKNAEMKKESESWRRRYFEMEAAQSRSIIRAAELVRAIQDREADRTREQDLKQHFRTRAETAEAQLAEAEARGEAKGIRMAAEACKLVYGTWTHESLPDSMPRANGAKECWDAILSLIPNPKTEDADGTAN